MMKKEKKVVSQSFHQFLILLFIGVVMIFLAVKIMFL